MFGNPLHLNEDKSGSYPASLRDRVDRYNGLPFPLQEWPPTALAQTATCTRTESDRPPICPAQSGTSGYPLPFLLSCPAQTRQYYLGHLWRVNLGDGIFLYIALSVEPVAESPNGAVVGVLTVLAFKLGQVEVDVRVGNRTCTHEGH